MKRSKKNSDEERSRKKKKSKSGKRRRRESSSPSSSYSSDSEDADSRSRRRSRRSKKPESRRKGFARPDRKKSRKAAAKASSRRRVSVSSSSSYSGRNCSTPRGRNGSPESSSVSERRHRLRSPSFRSDRKGKLKVRSGSRGRGRERSRRRMSRSCSSCERSRSSSSPRGRSPLRNRSLSKDKYRQIEQSSLLQQETAETKERKPVRGKIDVVNDDRAQISNVYDKIPNSRNYATGIRYEHGNHEEGQVIANKSRKHPVTSAHNIPEDNTEKKSESVNNVCNMEDENDLESQLRKRALENLKNFRGYPSGNTRLSLDVKTVSGDTQQHDDSPEVLEARQSALHSFRKSQRPPLPDTGDVAITEKESNLTCHHDSTSGAVDAHDSEKSFDCKNNASLDHRSILVEHQQKPRIRSIVHVPAERVTPGEEIGIQNNGDNSGASNTSFQDKVDDGQRTLNKGNIIEESTNKIVVSELNALEREKQHEMTFEVVESSTTHDAEVNKDGSKLTSRPSNLNKESGNGYKKEDSGSQYQKKTFSRMHDGELVQVSYKVYIPQKTPALARRKLQR